LNGQTRRHTHHKQKTSYNNGLSEKETVAEHIF